MLKTIEIPQKSTPKKHLESHRVKKIVLPMTLLILVLCISFVSAFDWETNTVTYWDFNNDSGSVLHNIKSGSFDGVLKNMTNANWVEGKIGNGLKFDRVDDEYISDIGRITTLESSNYTMNLWSRATLIDLIMWFNYDDDKTIGNLNLFMYESDGTNTVIYTGGGETTEVPSADLGYRDGNWKMMTFVQNSTHMYIYVNGTFNRKITSTGHPACAGCVFKIGGGSNAGLSWNGTFDEWGLFNKTLTPTEITELYNNGNGLAFRATTASLLVDLVSPINGASIAASNTTPTTFVVNHNSTAFTLINTTYNIWYTNNTLFNATTYAINSSNTTKQGFTITFGNFKWNSYTCAENSTSTLCAWADSNFTLDAGSSIDTISFPNNVSETERAVFNLNITLLQGANLFAARLNYDGVKYLGTKTSLNGAGLMLTRVIDIPLLKNNSAQNVSFHWEFEYKNGVQGNQNTSTFSHRVTPLIFQECNDTHSTMKVWNITVANESTRKFITSTLDGSFDFWLGTGTVIKDYSLNTPTGTTKGNYTFCANRENVNVSSIINVKSDGYFERTFYFNKENFNTSRTNTTLFLQTKGTPIIIQMTDPGLVALVGNFINVYRFYPDINEYLIVEKAQSDEFGQFVARLIEPNTVKYQFEFLDEDNNILKRTDDMTIACRTTFCVIPFVIEGDFNDFDTFQNVTDFDFSISFDNVTNIFTYTWNDVTGESISSRLLVERIAFNGTTTVCNSTSTASANTITCSVGSSKAKYRAQGFRTVAGENTRRMVVLNIEVGSTVGIFGLEGLFWAAILLLTLVGVGSFNPSVGVGLYSVGFIGLGVLGIISMPIPIFFANGILGILFIWAIRT